VAENKKMSLKYLFFPIILVLAVVIFWAYLWPEVISFQAVNKEYKTSQQALQNVQDKKTALESLNSQLKSDEKSSLLISNYLPSDRAEEKIIGEVNYLAANAGVFLDDIEIAKQEEKSNSVTIDSASLQATSNGQFDLKKQNANTLQSTQATITFNGDYDKLKIFFNGLQHMPLLNSIKTLDITTTEKAVVAAPGATTTEKPVTKITAKLVVDFGYLKQAKINGEQLADFKAEIDNKTVQALKEYTSEIVPKISTSGINIGSSNPFLPQ
jgi:hypothetical protein